ncbi:MAG: lytic murein transglycosylase, partial [Neisseria elongata]
GAEFSEVAAFLGEVFTVDSDGSAGGCFEAVIEEKTELKYTVGQLRRMGVEIQEPVADHERAVLFKLEVSPGLYEYYIGLNNFYAVWQYNHSRMYATAVRDIANGVGSGGL